MILTYLLVNVFIPVYAAEMPIAAADKENALNGDIIINGERVEAPAPYIHKDDPEVIMVPLRAIAERLGLTVTCEQEEEKVIVGYGIQLWIGDVEYKYDFVGINTLRAAPEIIGGTIFVPLDFIRYALEYDAYVTDGAVVIGESTASTVWISQDGNAIWFSEDSPYEYCDDSKSIHVGKSPGGGDAFALLRMSLRGDWLAEEVTGARLFLKVAEGTPPREINIGTVAKSWSPATLERDMVKTVIHENSFALSDVRREENGWVSMDVTYIVKRWLNGEMPNRGFALFPGGDGALGIFVSGASADKSVAPRIVISATASERSTAYGKFGFTKQPIQGFTNPIVGGNCLSYALRDIDGIIFEDLTYTVDDLNRIFFDSGENGVLEYVAATVEEYIEANKEGLQISSVRRIDSFDSPIDAGKEYRIVFRVSANATPELPMTEKNGFDFHLWAQLGDGRWTQKSPSVFSSVIPGTGPGISPLRYLWDAGDMWGIERWQEWYTSDGIYYAVTKDTGEFTCHKK